MLQPMAVAASGGLGMEIPVALFLMPYLYVMVVRFHPVTDPRGNLQGIYRKGKLKNNAELQLQPSLSYFQNDLLVCADNRNFHPFG